MKKFVAMFTLICMLTGAFLAMPISADEAAPADPLAENLIVYWDFEGATIEEQLYDKATGGTTKENLTLTSEAFSGGEDANDTVGLSPDTCVKDGKLHINHDRNDRAECVFDSTMGGDIVSNTTNEFTMYMEVQLNSVCTNWVDPFLMPKTLRVFFNTKNASVYSSIAIRHLNVAQVSHQVIPSKNNAYFYGDTMCVAVTYVYNADSKVLSGTFMFSADGGETWGTDIKEFADINEFLTNETKIMLGKGTAADDRNGDFVIDNVRIYNKALTLEQIQELDPYTPTEDEDDDNNTTESSDDNTTAPSEDNTTAPAEQNTTAAPATTEAPAEEKKGCGSSIAVGAMGMLILAVGATLGLRKKED